MVTASRMETPEWKKKVKPRSLPSTPNSALSRKKDGRLEECGRMSIPPFHSVTIPITFILGNGCRGKIIRHAPQPSTILPLHVSLRNMVLHCRGSIPMPTKRNNLPGIIAHTPNVFIFIISFSKLITRVLFPSPLLLTKPLKKETYHERHIEYPLKSSRTL